MNFVLWLARASRDFAERDALFHGTKSVASYAILGRLVAQTATWLSERGIRAAERVAIFMPSRSDYLPLYTRSGIWEGLLYLLTQNFIQKKLREFSKTRVLSLPL